MFEKVIEGSVWTGCRQDEMRNNSVVTEWHTHLVGFDICGFFWTILVEDKRCPTAIVELYTTEGVELKEKGFSVIECLKIRGFLILK